MRSESIFQEEFYVWYSNSKREMKQNFGHLCGIKENVFKTIKTNIKNAGLLRTIDNTNFHQ